MFADMFLKICIATEKESRDLCDDEICQWEYDGIIFGGNETGAVASVSYLDISDVVEVMVAMAGDSEFVNISDLVDACEEVCLDHPDVPIRYLLVFEDNSSTFADPSEVTFCTV